MNNKELAKLSLEDTFEKIDEIMNELQSDDVALEDSFALYKDGMSMLAHCREIIDGVEKKVIKLSGQSDLEDE